MTPVDHVATGAAGGAILALPFEKVLHTSPRVTFVMFTIGSTLPDIDALSLLMSSEIYHGKLWYSHHMFAHSFLGGAILSAGLALCYLFFANVCRGVRNLFREEKFRLPRKLWRLSGAFLACFFGCLFHLAGDYVTPPGPWKGLALYWPNLKPAGGISWIYWHNWYIIYISTVFFGLAVALQFFAGFVALVASWFKARLLLISAFLLRTGLAIIATVFLAKLILFIRDNRYNKMGYEKWHAYNRSLVPKEFQSFVDRHSGKFTVIWQRRLITRQDIIQTWNRVRDFGEKVQKKIAPVLSAILSKPSPSADMALFRALQKQYPGMQDHAAGDYRLWFFRDALPNPTYFDRGLLYYYVKPLEDHVAQVTNARIVAFHIEKRDAKGNATAVKRVFNSDKIYVPDQIEPAINPHLMRLGYHKLWDYEKIAYNAIPGMDYSRYMNLSGGFFPSIDTRTGQLSPWRKTGVYLHSGVWTAGCFLSVYGHLSIGQHLQSPFFLLWETADEYIDISRRGIIVRPGKSFFWGKMMLVKNPQKVKA